MKNSSKVQKILNLLIQSAVFLATYLFIFQKVFRNNSIASLRITVEGYLVKPEFQSGLMLVILLMLVNWSIEAYKWRFLIGKIEKVGFISSFQAVLTGITVSSFIPNRVGEFFGRIYILKTASRIEGILISIVGSMSQLLITIVAGSIAFLIFIPQFMPGTGFSQGYLYICLVVLVLSLNFLLVILFFKLSFLSALKERILKNGLKRLRKFFRIFSFFKNREIAIVILLSFSRYLVFSSQFYLLLILFGIKIPYLEALEIIALIYLVMAVIPTVVLTELGVRGSVALYLFGIWFGKAMPAEGDISMGVFAASTVLWIINLGIPALAGTVFLFRLQFFRKTAA